MRNATDIVFTPAQESDFESFYALRESTMKAHFERQGLTWDIAERRARHREILATEGVRRILYKNDVIGFVAVQYRADKNRVVIGRLCVSPTHQKQGLGTAIMQQIMDEPAWAGKVFYLDVLRDNPARRLYERLGFRQTHEDDLLAYYERPAPPTPAPVPCDRWNPA